MVEPGQIDGASVSVVAVSQKFEQLSDVPGSAVVLSTSQ